MKLKEKNLKYFKILFESYIVSKSDLEGHITFVNDNFIKATGFSREEVLGKNHNILRHPDTPNSVFKELWETIKSGKVFSERVLNRKKDGSDFWAETIIIPLLDEKNEHIIEYLALRRDITDFLYNKRKIEQERVEKQKQQEIEKAKDDFLILFSHELKTPLNAIINFSEYLLNNVEKTTIEKRKKLLLQICNSSKKMLEDVVQLIEISKLKSNKLQYNFINFSIQEAINEVLQKHTILTDQNNVSIIKCIEKEKIYINSDFYRFSQILSNIVSNAIKYSHGTVHLYTETTDENYRIIVEDNGNGVEDKEKIFELFEQNDKNVQTREKKGTGVGLSLVKLLCEDLNIEYKLEDSQALGGLKFILIIAK